jgi:probable selenium-dependent hydroxylase accessory protein YqeC
LVSTTTKMWPDAAPGVAVAGRVNAVTGKLEALSPPDLREQCACYDYVLLEADGAAGKPLKAWAAHEPVVPDYTTMTIGVLPLCTTLSVIDRVVHRMPLFCVATGTHPGEVVQSNALGAVIRGDLFYRACGTRVLYGR